MATANKIKLSVIIPIYNEEEILGQVINKVKEELEKIGLEYEIIAVNDCSKDQSRIILEKISGIKLINHFKNKGYGASLKTGIKHSRFDWVMIIDADGTYPTDAISKLIAETENFDLVVGSRETKNNAIPLIRRPAKTFLNKFASYLAGRKIPDLNSGLRLFRKEIVIKYWELFPNRFSFTSTLTMLCLMHDYETVFIPINYYKRKGQSSIRSRDFINFLKLVTKLSLFFKPIKVFVPFSILLIIAAFTVAMMFFAGNFSRFPETTFIILCATSLQTFFFGILAEIITHQK